jgi:hypothetical protein
MILMSESIAERNFSIIKNDPLQHHYLSMDEFDAFVEQDIQDMFDREAYEKEKAKRSANVQFIFLSD